MPVRVAVRVNRRDGFRVFFCLFRHVGDEIRREVVLGAQFALDSVYFLIDGLCGSLETDS